MAEIELLVGFFLTQSEEQMRPVHKNPANPSYQAPATFSFSGKSAKSVAKVLNVPSPNNIAAPVCLNTWHRFLRGDKSLPGTKTQQKEAVKAIQNKVADSYKLATVPLTQEL